jgi:outer membrane protein OmpA-like peptidoglycan-associated protein
MSGLADFSAEATAMRKMMLALTVSGLAMVAGAAIAAEARYSPDDVVSALLKSAEIGETRGLCVGTAEECNQSAKPAGFDVMVNFDLASANLTPDAVDNLKQVAAALADPRLSGAKFAIEGYTDARGTDVFNQNLSTERAKSVASYLMSQGVPAERLVAVGNGETSPRVPDAMDPINRRVEMRINLN